MLPNRMRRFNPTLLVCLAAAGLLTACATPEDSARLKAGWKSGYVQAIGTASEIGPQHAKLDCRFTPSEGDAAGRFVLVRYTNGRLRRSIVAPLPPGQDVGITQRVWVNSDECRAVEPRTEKG